MTNILFVNIPSLPWDELKLYAQQKNSIYTPFVMPMSILYLSASIKAKFGNRQEVQILDYNAHTDKIKNYSDNPEKFFSGLATQLIKFEPEIISITLNFACAYKSFLLCARELRIKYPKSIIIVGGIQASNTVHHLIKNPDIDYIICGEGEIAFPDCIEAYENGKTMYTIKGIYSKEKVPDKKPIITDMVENLDTIPYPDWDILDMNKYLRAGRMQTTHDINMKTATIITSRGCPFHCTFCSSHTIHGRKIRNRSVENVMGEIIELNRRYGIKMITFEDDLFTSDKKRTMEILSKIKQLNIEKLHIECPNVLSINTIDADILDLMVDCGLVVTNFALESGSAFTQKYIIKKHVNLEKAHILVNYLRQNHPKIYIRCMLLFGFPHETKELMLESLEFAKTLDLDWVAFAPATPLPGSEMYTQFIEMGVIQDTPEMWEKCHFGLGSRDFDTPEISARDLNEFIYQANLEVNFKNNHNMITGKYSRAIEQFETIVKHYEYHIIAWFSLLYCYKKLQDIQGVERAENQIKSLLESDERAIEMYQKYPQFIPHYDEVN